MTLNLVALVLGSLVVLVGVRAWLRWAFIVSKPDEWLLQIRNGRLVQAGVGISVFNRPGDRLARFTSTVQRVRFVAEALTSERLTISIEGFLLWAVSSKDDGPFVAFSKMGIANLADRPVDGLHRKHLLTQPQHKAFQQMLVAAVQRQASRHTLDELLSDQDGFLGELRAAIVVTTGPLGVAVEDLQILSVRPAESEVLAQLSTESSEELREEAERIRLETSSRIEHRELDASSHTDKQRLDAKHAADLHAAQAALALEEERGRLMEKSHALQLTRLEQESALRLAAIERKHLEELRDFELRAALRLAAEANTAELERSARQRRREEAELTTELRRESASVDAEAIDVVAAAESRKPGEVRAYEIARLQTERFGEMLANLPLKDARWVSIGGDSPVSSMIGMISAAKEAIEKVSGSLRDQA